MWYVVTMFWPMLAAAAAIGLLVGRLSRRAETAPADEIPAGETPAGETPAGETPADETPADETWRAWLAAYGILVLVAATRVVPGAAGLLLELFLLLVASYAAGCLLGFLAALRESAAAAAPAPTEVAAEDAVVVPAVFAGRRPRGLFAPRSGGPDDLTRIAGIAPADAARLNALGVWHLRQIAAWSVDEAHWVGRWLGAPDRPQAEDWAGRARDLAARDRAARDSGEAPADALAGSG